MDDSEIAEDKFADVSFYWNPGAISYLVELLLAVILALYLAMRAFREWRHRRLHLPTFLLALMFAMIVPALLTSLFRVLTAGGWVSYAMPWSPVNSWTTLAMPWARPFGGGAATTLVLFAYRFPRPLAHARRECIVVVTGMGLLVLAEVGMAIFTDLAIQGREAWWRPNWVSGWMNIGMVWAAVLFWRQFDAGQRIQRPAGARASRFARLWQAVAAIWRPAASREASAARGFVIFTLLPIAHTTVLLLPNEGQVGSYPLDIFICWSVLAQLVGLTLIFVGYLPDRSSFVFKLTVIGVALVLAAVNATAWIVAPAYVAQFRAHDLVSSGQALEFVPDHGQGYAVRPTAFAPDRADGTAIASRGARIALPFSLRFYGQRYDAAFVSARGSIGFDHIPRPDDAAFANGVQPAIFPLLVDVPKEGTRIFARARPDRLVVTRLDDCPPGTAENCYRLQTIIHPDGRFEVHYLAVPDAPAFALYSPLRAPWLVGAMPGWSLAGKALAKPAIRDYHREFLAYLDALYSPIVKFVLLTTLAVLAGLPLLFTGFLIKPLDRLLAGIRRFRNGAFGTQVAVSFNDEIGYLTDSFNEMARNQHALMQTMEERVASRVAEIADMTIRNAQLEERNRISADLHDAVAQALASASLLADTLPPQLETMPDECREAARLVAQMNRHALTEMRLLLNELRGEGKGEWSLRERLAELVRSFAELHSLDIETHFAGSGQLPTDVRAMVFRVAQEALNNVAKHSLASRVRVDFECGEDRAVLRVSDDGCGFDAASAYQRDRLGLQIMKDRSRHIGATIEIESRPREGCTVTMRWQRAHLTVAGAQLSSA